jgi:hypothetical protein
MKVQENRQRDCSDYDREACESLNAANTREWSACIAVAHRVLVAVSAQPFTLNLYTFSLTFCVQFVANMAVAASAFELIDKVCCSRYRPLIGIDLCAADITDLGLCHFHLAFGAR